MDFKREENERWWQAACAPLVLTLPNDFAEPTIAFADKLSQFGALCRVLIADTLLDEAKRKGRL